MDMRPRTSLFREKFREWESALKGFVKSKVQSTKGEKNNL